MREYVYNYANKLLSLDSMYFMCIMQHCENINLIWHTISLKQLIIWSLVFRKTDNFTKILISIDIGISE